MDRNGKLYVPEVACVILYIFKSTMQSLYCILQFWSFVLFHNSIDGLLAAFGFCCLAFGFDNWRNCSLFSLAQRRHKVYFDYFVSQKLSILRPAGICISNILLRQPASPLAFGPHPARHLPPQDLLLRARRGEPHGSGSEWNTTNGV